MERSSFNTCWLVHTSTKCGTCRSATNMRGLLNKSMFMIDYVWPSQYIITFVLMYRHASGEHPTPPDIATETGWEETIHCSYSWLMTTTLKVGDTIGNLTGWLKTIKWTDGTVRSQACVTLMSISGEWCVIRGRGVTLVTFLGYSFRRFDCGTFPPMHWWNQSVYSLNYSATVIVLYTIILM